MIEAWEYKHRPQKIEDLVLDKKLKDFFIGVKTKGDYAGNILLLGKSGIGKTTLAKLFAEDILDCQWLFIKASEENGIETVRNKISNFVQSKSLDGKKKVIILNEADRLSTPAQDALRDVMEEYLSYCIFILTGNNSHRITSGLKSRCTSYELTYPKKEYIKRILEILKKEDITFDKSAINIIGKYYPDFRKCLRSLQPHIKDGVLNTEDVKVDISSEFIKNVWGYVVKGRIHELRKYIIENEIEFLNDYHTLAVDLFNHICELSIEDNKKSTILIKLGEAIRYHNQVVDVEINLFSKLLEIKELL